MSQQRILSSKLVVLILPCLIVDLFLSKLQVEVTCLEIRGILPPTPSSRPLAWSMPAQSYQLRRDIDEDGLITG